MNDFSGSAADPTVDLRADLAGAFGLPVWGSRMSSLGIGSIFLLNLGRPDPGNTRWGQWHLRVDCAAWRIETPGLVLAACGDSREEMERGITMLDGKILVDAQVELPSLSATFLFADETRLQIFSLSGDYEQWVLFRPDGMVRIAGEEDSWILKPGGS